MRASLIAIIATCAFATTTSAQQQTMSLNLEQCRQLALNQNLEFRASIIDPLLNRASVTRSLGIHDPNLTASISGSLTEFPSRLITTVDPVTGEGTVSSASVPALAGLDGSFGLSKTFAFGTYSSLTANTSTSEQGGSESASTSLRFSVSQPLLRGFGREVTTSNIILARNQLDMSMEELQRSAFATVRATEMAYWDLVLAVEQLRVTELSLNEAEQLLERSRARAESGAQARYDILEAEAEVARRRLQIIQNRATVESEQDDLKRLTGIADQPNGWQVGIVPTEEPIVASAIAEPESLYAIALRKRPDVHLDDQSMERNLLTLRLRRNLLLPSLSATGNLTLNDGSSEGYGKSLDDIASASNPSWNLGLNLSLPIGNNTAEGNYRSAQLAVRKAELERQALYLKVYADVRAAHRNLASSRESIEAARVSVNVGEADMNNEKEKLRLGLSTNYDVLKKEGAFADSRRRYLEAQINHQRAIVELQVATGELLEVRGITVRADESLVND